MMDSSKERLNPMTLRKRVKKTQRQIADALGMRRETVAEWESGRSTPKLYPSQIKKLLGAYECTLDELIEAFEGEDVHAN